MRPDLHSTKGPTVIKSAPDAYAKGHRPNQKGNWGHGEGDVESGA